jgi:hypothetical protein
MISSGDGDDDDETIRWYVCMQKNSKNKHKETILGSISLSSIIEQKWKMKQKRF